MDLFTYILTTCIGFSGLFVGILISRYAIEEVDIFKKHIPFLQMVLLLLGFLVTFIYVPFNISLLIFLLSFAFIYLFWNKRDINTLDYVVFSILFILSSVNLEAHFYMTAIIFVFGILSGTLFFVLHTYPKKHKKHIAHHRHTGHNMDFDELSYAMFKKYFFFLIISILGYIISSIFVSLL